MCTQQTQSSWIWLVMTTMLLWSDFRGRPEKRVGYLQLAMLKVKLTLAALSNRSNVYF